VREGPEGQGREAPLSRCPLPRIRLPGMGACRPSPGNSHAATNDMTDGWLAKVYHYPRPLALLGRARHAGLPGSVPRAEPGAKKKGTPPGGEEGCPLTGCLGGVRRDGDGSRGRPRSRRDDSVLTPPPAGAVGGDDGRRLDQTGEARRLGETTGLSPITVTLQARVSAVAFATVLTHTTRAITMPKPRRRACDSTPTPCPPTTCGKKAGTVAPRRCKMVCSGGAELL
jgi:hypothetical protein